MDKPFLQLVISFIIGILIANYFEPPISLPTVGLLIGIISLIFNIAKDRKGSLNIIIIFILLGIILTTFKMDNKILKYVDERMEYTGIVEEILSSDNEISRYIVKIESNVVDGTNIGGRVRLNLVGGKTLGYGDRILFDGEIQEPLGNTNPMLYNHRLNLLSKNIYGSITINDYSLNIIDGRVDFRFRLKEAFHEEVNRVFDTHLKDRNSDIIKSMLLGDSSYLVEEDLDKYRELGLGHILAVSGLHIGIIASFILYGLMTLTISRKLSSIITIVIIVIYGFLIGFPHSMVRGTLMFSLIILTKISNEHSNSINVLSLAALITLFINPFSLFSLGFIMSYTAVMSLYLLTKKIETLFYPKDGYISSTLSAILGVNIGILPIQAYFFNYISLLGIIANILIIPILSLGIILSICLLLVNFIFPFLIPGLSIILNFLLDFAGLIGDVLHVFSNFIFNIASPSFNVIIIYYLSIAILFKIFDISKLNFHVKKTIVIFICLIIVLNFSYILMDDSLEMHFIDVGQGDSILLRSKGRNILIDTGGSLFSNYVIEQITMPYLHKIGVNVLDGIIITHFDADHSGGLTTLIDDNIRINNIYASYIPDHTKIYEKIKDNNIPFTVLKTGDKIRINENILCEVLWPEDTSSLNSNNKSLVMLFSYNDYKVLLTGDIEGEAELKLLDTIPPDIDVLKVAHHGSNSSSTKEFLEITRPENSIISVGRNNQYNHPNDEVISRLEEVNSNIYRTDEMGLIKVQIDDDLVISPFIEEENNSIMEFVYDNKWTLITYLIYYIISKRLIIIYKKYGADKYELCWI